ncbi:glycosyltransferase [Algibacter sp. PT7-4]|uniref:glycosyltransferase n=1 Tax=Algibacter ulvanivorans TaxID=3400999 RepID=UPI003AAEFB72
MNPNSNVTIIIPCYNDGKFIHEALNSALNQTLKADKIIIIDDGSDTETKAVIDKIKYDNVDVISQENRGVSCARNKAISLATTGYILNLDADDYLEPTFIEKTVEVLKKNKQVGVVSSYCRSFKGKNTEVEIIKPLGGNIKDFIVKNNGRANSIFRKQCWIDVGGYDEKMLKGYEDWEFWIAILKQGYSMHIVKEVLTHYRIKETSRDQTALSKHDFELRKYMFNKHNDVFKDFFDFYALELLRINSVLKNNVIKVNKSIDYKLGALILKPIRYIKQKLNG